MDVTKLRKAASLTSNFNLKQELLKIAQDLGNINVDNVMPSTPNNMIQDETGVVDQSGQTNPNIKSFAKPGGGVEKELHKITIQVEVPPGTDETSILNKIMEKLKQDMEQSGDGFRLKGYSFDER